MGWGPLAAIQTLMVVDGEFDFGKWHTRRQIDKYLERFADRITWAAIVRLEDDILDFGHVRIDILKSEADCK